MALTAQQVAAIPEEDITFELAQELFPPVTLGPTWQVDGDGNYILPKLTLGWGVLAWCSVWLLDPNTGDPWRFTPEQARFILWFYEVNERGIRTNRKAVFQRLKGHGKDPLAVAIGMAELLGPVLYSHPDPNAPGGVKGKARRSSLVCVAAVSKDQGVANTMHMAPEMISERCIQEYNLDIQKEVIQVKGRPAHRFMAITGSFKSAEGNRPHFIIMNEPHHWTPSLGGPELYETLWNNLRKTAQQGSSMLAITNAYVPGEDSVLERMRYSVDQFRLGLAKDPNILYDSLEAHPSAPFDELWGPHIVRMCAGDSYWVPWELVAEGFADQSISEARERRMWYNRVVEPEDSVFSEEEWDNIRAVGYTGTKGDLRTGDMITLGFDGGRKDDATALVAIRVSDRLIVPLAVWSSPPRKSDRKAVQWEMDPRQVDNEVALAFHSYNVVAFFADVQGYDSWIYQWEAKYGHRLQAAVKTDRPIAYDMRGHREETIRGHEAFMEEVIFDKSIHHNGDPVLRMHALNARRRTENRWGIDFAKESPESPNKIDAYAATICAYLALRKLMSTEKTEPARNRSVHYG